MKAIYQRLFLFIAFICLSISNAFASDYNPEKKYFATCSDSNYYSRLCNLIGSIHRVHSDDLGEIAVYDLGLLPEQIKQLKSMYKVEVYDIEMTNPDIKTYLHKTRNENVMVRGLYSFKPVVVKQALDLFPCILYLDAGCLVLKPLDDLFKHIQQNSYFLVSCRTSIRFQTTNSIIEKFDLRSNERKWILDRNTYGLAAGSMGVTREVYDSFVMPIYELSKDIRNFMDDGSSPEGFFVARHDQTLFSIQARLSGMKIYDLIPPTLLNVDNKQIPFYVNYGRSSAQTHLLLQGSYTKNLRSFIKYKNSGSFDK
jgi:hypothetical protein